MKTGDNMNAADRFVEDFCRIIRSLELTHSQANRLRLAIAMYDRLPDVIEGHVNVPKHLAAGQ